MGLGRPRDGALLRFDGDMGHRVVVCAVLVLLGVGQLPDARPRPLVASGPQRVLTGLEAKALAATLDDAVQTTGRTVEQLHASVEQPTQDRVWVLWGPNDARVKDGGVWYELEVPGFSVLRRRTGERAGPPGMQGMLQALRAADAGIFASHAGERTDAGTGAADAARADAEAPHGGRLRLYGGGVPPSEPPPCRSNFDCPTGMGCVCKGPGCSLEWVLKRQANLAGQCLVELERFDGGLRWEPPAPGR